MTLSLVPDGVPEAEETFNGLGRAERIAIVRELVTTRAAELCRAWKDVVSVGYGLRRRRDRDTGTQQVVTGEPCVKFIVRTKWHPDRRGAKKHELPKHLFAFWSVAGERRLCAVPTDVEDSHERAAVRPHGAAIVARSTGGNAASAGAIACLIRRSTAAGLFAIGCKHVLTPTWTSDDTFVQASVTVQNGPAVGTTVDVSGVLSRHSQFSHDAQLVRIDGDEGMRRATAGARITDYATSEDEVLDREELWIITPDGPIACTAGLVPGFPINYGSDRTENITHRSLLELRPVSPTRTGQSGSPVVTRRDGGVLAGMLIAGPSDRPTGETDSVSYAIPAWELFNVERYPGRDDGEKWTFVETP